VDEKLQRVGNLFEKVCSFENLYSAYKKAARGTKGKKETDEFCFFLEYELLKLKNELITENYSPGKYKYFTIKDPKEREIAVAPFRDRVVHHAIINILEPIYEKIFIFDSYATRKEKGTHKAILRAQEFLRKNEWYLKSDISKYFASIDHYKIIEIIKGKIKDRRLINLIEIIIRNGGENGKGLPIGNLTSQFFANVYLDRFDHYIKDELGIKYYVRYMDDIVIFANDKRKLKEISAELRNFLNEELSLDMKTNATYINKRINGVTFLGKRIFPNIIRIKNENLKRSIKRIERRENEHIEGKIDETKLCQSVESIIGMMKHYNVFEYRKEYMRKTSLRRPDYD
jgi:retron-type reverse transcriptase